MEMVPIEAFLPGIFAEGEKIWRRLALWEGGNGEVSVPVAVVRGRVQGPIIITVAGVHGDEFEGMEAIRGLVAELDPEKLSGTFIGIPVINPFAYEGQMRETPAIWDGLNLARQFPGKEAGSVTERLAYLWSNWLIRILGPEDVFIDFHSAGTRYEYLSMVAFHETKDQTEQRSRDVAQAFGLKRVWRIPDRPETRVTFNGCIARRGITTIATEVRGRGGCLKEDVAELQKGLQRILCWKGMLSPGEREIESQRETIWSTEWIHIRAMGFFRPRVELQERVEAGQVLGEIIGLTGEKREEVCAPQAGEIWGIRRFSTVQAGDYVFLLAFTLQETLEPPPNSPSLQKLPHIPLQ